MKADVHGTRLYFPSTDGNAVRPRREMPVVVVRQPAPASAASACYGWYKPVTFAVSLLLVAVVVVVATRTSPNKQHQTDASELAPLTTANELRETGNRALALVNYSWHDLGYEIVFAPGERDLRAQTDVVAHRITVFLAKGDAAHRVAHDIGHELGHAYDAKYLTEADRVAFLNARGKHNVHWFPGNKFSDYDTGAGDFAEVFASCHAASPEFRSRVAPKPAQPCSLIPPPHAV